MKCSERLVMADINPVIPDILDPLHPHMAPTDDAISIALHTALS
jgi:hypothetical protein